MAIVAEYLKQDNIVSCKPDATLREASRIMTKHNVGSLLVINGETRLVGIFTERDLTRAIAGGADPDRDQVREFMSKEIIAVAPYESIVKAGQKMLEHGIRHMPVIDSAGKVIGVISIRDALRAILASSEFP
ncbi:MAG: CBS domain-containing protein [Desulfurococcales archaeon]|nr:CBS domain-containing protein [Desulfurococcales archaeon]MEB3778870.1 CBS domain-containing protein [Desulfurococcales archaeon]